MKRLNLSYINVICVFVLSFAVMEYVNLLIGRVGGFPVLAGVLVSYSIMRYGSFARKNMACYMGIYILTWFIGTVALFISKYSGWGNIKKLGPAQYFKALYGSTLSEIWGYFFCNCAHADSDCFTFSAYSNKKQENICTVCVGKYAFLDDNTHTA